MLVSFANFLRLNDSDDNTVRSCTSALRSYGKILSQLAYFDYDLASPEQVEEALLYSAEVKIDEAQGLHRYMKSVREFYQVKQQLEQH